MADLPSSLAGRAAGTSRISTEVVKEHQRERVVEASISVFAEKGYRGATVDDIVSAAKIGVGNFYGLLGGKDECFAAALDRAISIVGDGLSDSSSEDLPARFHYLLRALAANREAARLILIEARRADRQAKKSSDELMAELAEALRRNRSSSGSYPKDLEFGLLSGAGAAIAETLRDEGDLEALFEPIARFCLAPYFSGKELQRLIAERPS